MAKKRKVKKKGKFGKFSPDQLANMMMEEIKKQMVKTGFATPDQIAAAEIQMQQKEGVNDGDEIPGNPDRDADVPE